MLLGKVVGSVWGARQARRLQGQRLLIVRPVQLSHTDGALEERGDALVAVDQLGAGPGDTVLVTRSSRCRDLTVGAAVPDKDVVIAIVDGAALDAAGGAA